MTKWALIHEPFFHLTFVHVKRAASLHIVLAIILASNCSSGIFLPEGGVNKELYLFWSKMPLEQIIACTAAWQLFGV